MNAYRAVIAGTIVLALLSVLVFAALSDAQATYAAAGELIALLVGDVVATIYVIRLVRRDRRRPRSWLLLFLATGSAFISTGLVVIAVVILRRLFGLPPLEAGLGLRLVGMGLLLVAYVPVMKAALFYLVQRDPSASRAERLEDASHDQPA